MPMHHVTVEQRSGEHVVLLSPLAHTGGEALMIHLPMPAGLASHMARVVSSRPVCVEGVVCFRVELSVDPGGPPSDRDAS